MYRYSILSRVATVPGFAAKQVEDTKFKADMTSAHPISTANGGRHTFVPFAIEDGGRIGAHGQVVMRMLGEHAVAKGKIPPGPKNATPPSSPVAVSLWVRKWQQRLSTWLHLTLSRRDMRYGTLHPPFLRGRATLRLCMALLPVVLRL